MNIDRHSGDFERAERSARGPAGRAWSGVKSWSSRNPRLSRVVWFALALALLALIISHRDVPPIYAFFYIAILGVLGSAIGFVAGRGVVRWHADAR